MRFEGSDKTDYKSVIRASGLQIRKSGVSINCINVSAPGFFCSLRNRWSGFVNSIYLRLALAMYFEGSDKNGL